MKEYFTKYTDAEASRIAGFVAGYIRGDISSADHSALDKWLSTAKENIRLFEKLTDNRNREASMQWMREVNSDFRLRELQDKLKLEQAHRRKKRLTLFKNAMSACFVIGVGMFFYFYAAPPSNEPPTLPFIKNDIVPGIEQAVLTLNNGRKIELDSIRTGKYTKEKGIRFFLETDNWKFRSHAVAALTAQHIITVPPRGKYQLELSDGSKVWLNADSEIRFPPIFPPDKRVVELSGEAYFEIGTNSNSPFLIRTARGTVETKGATINVNAYPNDPLLYITSFVGSVSFANSRIKFQFGQNHEVSILENDTVKSRRVQLANLAWMHDEFLFENDSLEVIARELERWYGAKIIYADRINDRFTIRTSRNQRVSQLLISLQATSKLQFEIDNNTITFRN
ncbi:MAG: FecR family protein [Chitinophagaceae bacterium]|nr:FecR family protein [Chitinophagaceae bacterium]